MAWLDFGSDDVTNYNDGKWHSRKKGDTVLLHEKTKVQWKNTNGDSHETLSGTLSWDDADSEVIAFRVVKEYREPPKPRMLLGYARRG